MSMDALVEFLGKVDKKTDTQTFEAARTKHAAAIPDEVRATAHMLVDVGQAKGYNFTVAEVTQYLEHMKTLYYTSSPVRVLMDAFCTTSCHIGSQIQKP
jgi:hypothetical protein